MNKILEQKNDNNLLLDIEWLKLSSTNKFSYKLFGTIFCYLQKNNLKDF